MMDKYIGRLLDDRYEMLEVIGIGGMAVVYKAKCHKLNRMVAIKVLKDDYLDDEDFRERFHAEGQAVAMLSHPNIVSVYDVSASTDMDYIVMELIEGISLKQYIEKKGILNWKETLHFSLQIAKALEHAHNNGIVHRDIKPHNIMVLRNGTVKVADFGIARGIAKGNTLRKEALGSVHYISPEQAKGEHVDARSDIYSLGVVMYEMATAKRPYEGTSPINVALQHINGGAPMPTTINNAIPKGFEQIIMKAMAQNPANRYDSAVELQEAIEQFQKNPRMVFPYPMPEAAPRKAPKTDAPRVVQIPQKGEEKKKPAKLPEDGRKRSGKNAPEDKNTKVARIAIIACSVATLLAIGILTVLLLNPFSSGDKMVSVPNLSGRVFATLPSYPGLTIAIGEEVYDSYYDVGQIISQDVSVGSSVLKGTTIYVTVSKGPEPKIYHMKDVVGKMEAEAYTILTQIGVRLEIKVVYEEKDASVKAGIVLRTDPAKDTVLTDGQTITLYVSKSKTIEKSQIPSQIVGKTEGEALKLLKANKFENVMVEYVESDTVPAGSVVRMSEKAGDKVDIAKLITLYVSSGPAPTEPPTEETQPEGGQ